MSMPIDSGLPEPAGAAARLTATFVAKLIEHGVSPENAIYEGYKFAEVALRGDTEILVRMDIAAIVAGHAASAAGIHPDMQKWQREQAEKQWSDNPRNTQYGTDSVVHPVPSQAKWDALVVDIRRTGRYPHMERVISILDELRRYAGYTYAVPFATPMDVSRLAVAIERFYCHKEEALQSKNKQGDPRDTQFLGSATKALNKVSLVIMDTTLPIEEQYRRANEILAQYVYDLVCHTIKAQAYGMDLFAVNDPEWIRERVEPIPDITIWPKEG